MPARMKTRPLTSRSQPRLRGAGGGASAPSVVEGWAAPPDGPRPRRHPRRQRVRTAVAVDRAGAYVAVVRARDGEPEVMPPGGKGALMEELLQVWQRAAAVES